MLPLLGMVVRGAIGCFLLFYHASAWAGVAEQHVVILYSNVFGLPAHQKNAAAFLARLQASGVPATNIHYEFLDLVRPRPSQYKNSLPQWLEEKYLGLSVAAVVTVDGAAQEFVLNEGADLFSRAPLISVLSPKKIENPPARRKVIQLPPAPDFVGSLNVALKLFPKTQHVLCVIGASADEASIASEARESMARFPSLRTEITDGLKHEEMLQRVKSAQRGTLVFMVSFYRDSAGKLFVPKAVASEVLNAASVPVLTTYDGLLGLGVLGGSLFGYETEGERAAEIVLGIMDGSHPVSAPLTTLQSIHRLMFDWKQLQRWGVEDAEFPESTFFVNRPKRLWDEYRIEIIAIAIIFLLQCSLIAALLVLKQKRRKAEQDLQEREASLRSLLENAPDAICVFDVSQQRFVSCNRSAETLFGLPREELLKRDPRDFYPEAQPDGRSVSESFQSHLQMALEGRMPQIERLVRSASGEEHFCEVRLTHLPSSDGTLIRASFLDVTARRQAEGARSLFLATLSHELRTPLNAVIGFSEILLVSPEVTENHRTYLNGIVKSSHHLLRLITDLLSFARSEAVGVQLEPSEFSWDELMLEIERMVAPLVRTGVALRFSSGHTGVRVAGDRMRIMQVFLNILGNAAKFTEFGEIMCTSALTVNEKVAEIEVCVSDTGVGIGAEYLKKLFVPFTQQDSSLTRPFGGSGLGLAICKRFMTAMNGDIRVESEQHRGTRVTLSLRLPIARADEAEGTDLQVS